MRARALSARRYYSRRRRIASAVPALPTTDLVIAVRRERRATRWQIADDSGLYSFSVFSAGTNRLAIAAVEFRNSRVRMSLSLHSNRFECRPPRILDTCMCRGHGRGNLCRDCYHWGRYRSRCRRGKYQHCSKLPHSMRGPLSAAPSLCTQSR